MPDVVFIVTARRGRPEEEAWVARATAFCRERHWTTRLTEQHLATPVPVDLLDLAFTIDGHPTVVLRQLEAAGVRVREARFMDVSRDDRATRLTANEIQDHFPYVQTINDAWERDEQSATTPTGSEES
jgi:hypothetical protein